MGTQKRFGSQRSLVAKEHLSGRGNFHFSLRVIVR
jgi:hypothetical protein